MSDVDRLTEQIQQEHDNAVRLGKAGDKQQALIHLRKKKELQKELEAL
jgi:hypothetical protein